MLKSKYNYLDIVDVKDHPRKIYEATDILDAYSVCYRLGELCDKYKGLGMAAPQIGIPLNLFVARTPPYIGTFNSQSLEPKYTYYANMSYRPGGGLKLSTEGCLSLPGKEYRLYRWEEPHFTGKSLQ